MVGGSVFVTVISIFDKGMDCAILCTDIKLVFPH